MRKASRSGSIAVVSVLSLFGLAGCPDPKGNDPTATGTSTTADTDGTVSVSTSTSASTTSTSTTTQGVTESATGPTTGVGTSTGTSGTDFTTAATTGECQIEVPGPGECMGLSPHDPGPPVARAGARARDALKRGGADDESFASTGDTTGCAFICIPDMGEPNECDIFMQDCGPGEKCNAWANDGSNSWNATKCVPAGKDPVGAPCTVEGSPVSGFDSCVKGAMCWDVDTDTGKGTCVEQCSCSIDNPICTAPNTVCTISNNASLALCLPVCDPLDVDSCPAGELCLPSGGEFFNCVADASGDQGKAGDPCEFINACDPGHTCTDPSLFPGCSLNDLGCCVPFCSLVAATCPQGTNCTPWYEPGQAPKCFEDVGVCTNL